MIRVGVIGLGNVSPNRHVPWIRLNSKSQLVAVSDLREERVREFAGRLGVTGYTDFERMLDEESIDAVHVCTPPQTHLDIGTELLERGVPVLFEKPAAMSAEEVAELRDLAQETDTLASVVYNRLYEAPVREALRRVERGEIGDVVSVDHIYGRDNDLEDSPRGDWIYDMIGAGIGEGLPHQIYLPLAFVEGLGEVTGVSVRDRAGYETSDFDGLDIEAIDNDGSRMVSIKRLSNTTTQDLLIVHGTDGTLTVDAIKQGVFSKDTNEGLSAGAFLEEHIRGGRQLVANFLSNGIGFAQRSVYRKMGDERGEQNTPHFGVIDDFYDAVRTSGDPPVPLDDAYDTARVMDAVAGRIEGKAERRATQPR